MKKKLVGPLFAFLLLIACASPKQIRSEGEKIPLRFPHELSLDNAANCLLLTWPDIMAPQYVNGCYTDYDYFKNLHISVDNVLDSDYETHSTAYPVPAGYSIEINYFDYISEYTTTDNTYAFQFFVSNPATGEKEIRYGFMEVNDMVAKYIGYTNDLLQFEIVK